jgi:hypothetical protein
MTTSPDSDRTPAQRVDDIPRVLSALKEAVQEALLRHKLAGNAVAVWRNGRVEWVAPEDIPLQTKGAGKN